MLYKLHGVFFLYSLAGICGKSAYKYEWFSIDFLVCYTGLLVILIVYAIIWQNIIKKIPLAIAMMNKSATIIWGIIWSAVFFNEQITLYKIMSVVLIITGMIFFSSGGEE